MGLINKVVPHEQVLPSAFELADRLLRHSPLAAARNITAVTRRLNATSSEGLQMESEQFARMVPSFDIGEALDAWIARRAPSYRGL